MPNKQGIHSKVEQEFYKTYNRYPVILTMGTVCFTIRKGKNISISGAGIAVMGLGYNDNSTMRR